MSFLDVHALPSLTYYSLNGLLHSLRYRLLPLERYAGYPCCIGRDFTWRSSAGERFQKFNTKIVAWSYQYCGQEPEAFIQYDS